MNTSSAQVPFIPSFIHSFINPFIPSFIYSFIHFIIHSFNHPSSSPSSSLTLPSETILAKYRKSPVSETPTPLPENVADHPLREPLPAESFPAPSYTTSPLFHHSLPGGSWGADGDAPDSTKTPGTFRQSAGSDPFADAKKKLRLVLSTIDCSQVRNPASDGGDR